MLLPPVASPVVLKPSCEAVSIYAKKGTLSILGLARSDRTLSKMQKLQFDKRSSDLIGLIETDPKLLMMAMLLIGFVKYLRFHR